MDENLHLTTLIALRVYDPLILTVRKAMVVSAGLFELERNFTLNAFDSIRVITVLRTTPVGNYDRGKGSTLIVVCGLIERKFTFNDFDSVAKKGL